MPLCRPRRLTPKPSMQWRILWRATHFPLDQSACRPLTLPRPWGLRAVKHTAPCIHRLPVSVATSSSTPGAFLLEDSFLRRASPEITHDHAPRLIDSYHTREGSGGTPHHRHAELGCAIMLMPSCCQHPAGLVSLARAFQRMLGR